MVGGENLSSSERRSTTKHSGFATYHTAKAALPKGYAAMAKSMSQVSFN